MQLPVFKPTVPATKFLTSRGAKIRYADIGKGRAVVLVHGFLESLEMWFGNGFAEQLAKKFRVIAIDLPGHGKSDVMGYVQKMERMADVVKDVMDEVGLRKYVLVGHSMGGYVSLAFAEKYPECVSGLCLFHSTARPDSDEKKNDRDRAIKIVKRDPIRYTNQLVINLFAVANQKYMKKEINWMRRIAAKTKKQSIAACLEGMKIRKGREKILRDADYPVMLIAGTRDVVVPFKSLEEQNKLLKDGRFVVLERTGHMGFLEAKDITLKKLQQFCGYCYRKKIR
ncbi:MAG TPA: alpha/beta hydrolase [Bacteroidia bacterium]|jgi:pimeloyl-ACP methyl ester carboxylesterase|nr:alpha/beta hydrolase [Bacteroidia bacterium]